MMLEKCDMCGTDIINGKCSCGTWKSNEDTKGNKIREALDEFHEMKQFVLSGDSPHLGCAVVFFRGDYKDCEKVKKFIYEMKGRPYYE